MAKIDAQMERMKDLMKSLDRHSMNESTNKKPISKFAYQMIGGDGKSYAIMREGRGYYIKSTTADKQNIVESYDYVGGWMGRKEYSSYNKALKNFELKMRAINENVGSNAIVETLNPVVKHDIMDESAIAMSKELSRQREIFERAKMISETGYGFKVNCTETPEAPKKSGKNPSAPFVDVTDASLDKDPKFKSNKPESQSGPFGKKEKTEDYDVVKDSEIPSEGKSIATESLKFNRVTCLNESEMAEYAEYLDDMDLEDEEVEDVNLEDEEDVDFEDEEDVNLEDEEDEDFEDEEDEDFEDEEDEDFEDEEDEDFEDEEDEDFEVEEDEDFEDEEDEDFEVEEDEDFEDEEDEDFEDEEDEDFEVEELDEEYNSDSEYDEDEDDLMLGERNLSESKKHYCERIVTEVAQSFLNESKLNVFGKHPGYRKKPFTTPKTGEDKTIHGRDWNDSSVYSEKPFGSKKGSSAPFDEDIIEMLTDNVMRELKKKTLSTNTLLEKKVLKVKTKKKNNETPVDATAPDPSLTSEPTAEQTPDMTGDNEMENVNSEMDANMNDTSNAGMNMNDDAAMNDNESLDDAPVDDEKDGDTEEIDKLWNKLSVEDKAAALKYVKSMVDDDEEEEDEEDADNEENMEDDMALNDNGEETPIQESYIIPKKVLNKLKQLL